MIAPSTATVCTNGQLDVARARWQVEHQVVQIVPGALPQELLHVARGDGAAHDHSRLVIDQEAHAHQLQIIALDRDDLLLVIRQRALVRAEHVGNAGAVEIAVAQAHARAGLGQRHRQIARHRALAHAAFATGYGDDLLHARNARLAHGAGLASGLRRVLDVEVQPHLADAGQRLQRRHRLRV